jgi:membrane protein YdbS with pleckstrin-like domain
VSARSHGAEGSASDEAPSRAARSEATQSEADGTESLDPRILTVWRVQAGLTAAVPALIAFGFGAMAIGDAPLVSALAVACVAVLAVLVWWFPALHYRRWRFTLAEDRLDLSHGVVWHTRSSVPHFRVQHIDVEQGPIERRLGLAQLKLHTASAGTDASLPGLAVERAEAIRAKVLDHARGADAV